ncbi:MAG: PorT family protein [Paramuribaculum sp.]|nr:PorT family protein [Paramuribaculum sp.]
MKKFMAAMAVATCLMAPSAASAQFRYGPTAGVTFTNLHFKQDLMTVDQTVGFGAGITGEMMFPGLGFGVDVGLAYEQRGATLHMGENEMWRYQGLGTERSYLHYVTIPLHLRFKYTKLNGVEDKIAPLAYAGPTFGFLAGHSKNPALEYSAGTVSVEFGLGVELWKHWQVSASYTLGATYALKAKILTDYSAQNRVWALRAAYLF